MIVADVGLSVTVATGTGVTVMLAVPLTLPVAWVTVAVIVLDPAATPVTRPEVETVATAVLLLDHVTVGPVRVLPLASLRVAVSCWV